MLGQRCKRLTSIETTSGQRPCWSKSWPRPFGGRRFNPLSPHDVLKHHFRSLKTDLISQQLRILKWKFPWNWLSNIWHFSLLFTHIKSFSYTTSRELRQQFAACSGWRWQMWNRLERVKTWSNKHESAAKCCFNVGPGSQTFAQPQSNIGSHRGHGKRLKTAFLKHNTINYLAELKKWSPQNCYARGNFPFYFLQISIGRNEI